MASVGMVSLRERLIDGYFPLSHTLYINTRFIENLNARKAKGDRLIYRKAGKACDDELNIDTSMSDYHYHGDIIIFEFATKFYCRFNMKIF